MQLGRDDDPAKLAKLARDGVAQIGLLAVARKQSGSRSVRSPTMSNSRSAPPFFFQKMRSTDSRGLPSAVVSTVPMYLPSWRVCAKYTSASLSSRRKVYRSGRAWVYGSKEWVSTRGTTGSC